MSTRSSQGFDWGSDGTPFGSDSELAQGWYDEGGNLHAINLTAGDNLFFEYGTGKVYEVHPTFINGEVASLNAELLVDVNLAYAGGVGPEWFTV
jgi:hypothetical protein